MSTKISAQMKAAIVQGVINTWGSSDSQFLKVYNLLMNLDSVKRIKPFNFLKNKNEITDTSGLFSEWLTMFECEERDFNISCRRVSRSVAHLASLYGNLLPYNINGEDSFCNLFRVFFIPYTYTLSLEKDVLDGIHAITSLLKVVIWLELISSSPKYQDNNDWLLTILENTGGALVPILDNLVCSMRSV